MADVWVGPDGLRVVAVRLTRAHGLLARLSHLEPGGSAFLVTRRGALVAYVSTLEDLAEIVDLAELREA